MSYKILQVQDHHTCRTCRVNSMLPMPMLFGWGRCLFPERDVGDFPKIRLSAQLCSTENVLINADHIYRTCPACEFGIEANWTGLLIFANDSTIAFIVTFLSSNIIQWIPMIYSCTVKETLYLAIVINCIYIRSHEITWDSIRLNRTRA